MSNLYDLFDDLVRLQIDLWNTVDSRLKTEFDLPLARFEPMRVIDSVEHCRVQDIASELSITVGGTSKLVDRIEASGHCERRSNPTDRRSSWIELTNPGERLLRAATAAVEEELQARLGRLETSTVARLRADLHRARSANRGDESTEYEIA